MGSRCESIIGIFSGQSSPVFPRFPLLRLFFFYSHFFSSILHSSHFSHLHFTLHFTFIYIHLYCIYSHCIHPHRVYQLQLSSARNVQLSSPRVYLFLCSILYCQFLPLFSIFILFIHCPCLSPALHSVSFYTQSTCPPGALSPPFR